MRLTFALTVTILAAAAGSALAHPPPPPPDYEIPPPQIAVAPPPKVHTAWEAQVGGGLGRYAASNERSLGFSIGWHRVSSAISSVIGNELGADLDLRLGTARDGSSVVIGIRPVARRLGDEWRVPSVVGLVAPEVAWSSGDGRQRALRVEWSLPIALAVGHHSASEWDVARGGAVFADDGVHASFGTELRFVLR